LWRSWAFSRRLVFYFVAMPGPFRSGEFGRARRGPLGAPLGALGGDAGSHARTRHDGCGGHAGKAELLTGIEGVSSRPVRKIVLRVE
jgi:hypothetical protein